MTQVWEKLAYVNTFEQAIPHESTINDVEFTTIPIQGNDISYLIHDFACQPEYKMLRALAFPQLMCFCFATRLQTEQVLSILKKRGSTKCDFIVPWP